MRATVWRLALVYNALLGTALLALAPVLAVWVLLAPRLRRGFAERLRPLAASRHDTVWLHAASVGEAEAAAPLLERLLAGDAEVVATTLTRTGCGRLRARFPALPVRLAPLDVPGLVDVSLRRARARVLVLVETELWPNLIWAARRAGCRVLVVSGRLSARSLRRYRLARPFFASALRSVDAVAARDAEDAARFVALGAPAARVAVEGDLKLDRAAAPAPGPELRAAVGGGPLLIAGSTHPGEEDALLAAWSGLRSAVPGLRLLLAPRHVERAGALLDSARKWGARAGLRSAGAAGAEVVVLDTLGELASVYQMGDLVFAGGTLAPVGGHNLIEPIRAGRCVVAGPHLESQLAQADLLASSGALHRVESPEALEPCLRALWADPDRDAPARRAARELAAHAGAAERAARRIAGLLGPQGAAGA